jgi:hypothetical protein
VGFVLSLVGPFRPACGADLAGLASASSWGQARKLEREGSLGTEYQVGY